MRSASIRGAASRSTALLLGVGCSLLVIGLIVAYSLMRGSAGPNPQPSGSPGGTTPPPTNVTTVGRTGHAFNEFIDKQTGRVKQHVAWREMNPLPNLLYEIVTPRAWIYLKDGKTLDVRAASGKIRFTPESKLRRPESGRFEGGVLIRLYDRGVLTPDQVRDTASLLGSKAGVADAFEPIITTPPILVGYAQTLNFDTLLNEYSTSDRVMVSTPELESEFSGLRVVYNEVEARPDLVEAAAGFVRLTRSAKPERSQSDTSAPGGSGTPPDTTPVPDRPAPAAARAGTGDTPPANAAPKIHYYRTDFAESVDLSARGQKITADKLLLWLKLVDGKLPEASASVGSAPARSPDATAASSPSNPDAVAVSPPQSPPAPPRPAAAKPAPGPSLPDRLATLRAMPPGSPRPLAPLRDDDTLLTWSGPVSLYSLEGPPAELAADDVAARFVAESSAPVTLRDTRQPDAPMAMCTTLDYGVTTRLARLSGPAAQSVVLVDPRHRRRAAVDLFSINLASGVAQALGGGVLTAIKDEPPIDPSASEQARLEALMARLAAPTDDDSVLYWTDQADFVFDLDRGGPSSGARPAQVSDAGIKAIKQAMFSGNVVARQERSLVSGDFLKATFAPSARNDAVFTRVEVEGHAHGQTHDSRNPDERKRLDADRFDIAFSPGPDGKESNPSLLTAIGHVTGQQVEVVTIKPGDSPADAASDLASSIDPSASTRLRVASLKAGLLEAQLRTIVSDAGKKRTDVSVATCTQGVEFQRSDGIAARSDAMRADLVTKDLDFTGPQVVLTRGASEVHGTDIHVNGAENSIDVRSAGAANHTGSSATAGKTSNLGDVNLSWSGLMSFNDSTGAGESAGAVRLVHVPGPLARTIIDADRVGVQMEPAAEARARVKQAKAGGDASPPDRLLRTARALGTGDTPDTRARIESREYAPDASAENGRRLDRLTYLEAREILADEQHGVLDVPTSGRALILDHRAVDTSRSGDETRAPSPLPTGNQRGTTLLTWAGSLRFSRPDGLAEMNTGAELTHKPLDPAQQPLKIIANRMEGRFVPAATTLPANAEANRGAAPDTPLSTAARDQLVSAVATGDVVATTLNDDMRLSAARIEFDARTNVLTATAGDGEGQHVEYVDTKRATPIVGKKLIVHVKPDGRHEMTIIEPMPIVAPIPK